MTQGQRPSTAKGVVFVTLEDETGTVNSIIRPASLKRNAPCCLAHRVGDQCSGCLGSDDQDKFAVKQSEDGDLGING